MFLLWPQTLHPAFVRCFTNRRKTIIRTPTGIITSTGWLGIRPIAAQIVTHTMHAANRAMINMHPFQCEGQTASKPPILRLRNQVSFIACPFR
jgi:hypothetical protein